MRNSLRQLSARIKDGRTTVKLCPTIFLRESLRQTGFWENVVARLRNGKAEIAYGHHRLVALKEEYGPSHKVDLIIRKLDDTTMIQIMAQENMQEWESDAAVIQETIRAVVEAYGDGLITLPPMGSKRESVIRYAPSFTPNPPGEGGGRPALIRISCSRSESLSVGLGLPAGRRKRFMLP